nr:hypothetical protein [Tanacetum cinerariifolium]
EEEAAINDDDSDDKDKSDDERTESDSDVILDPNKTYEEHDEEEKEHDDELNLKEDKNINGEENDEVTNELYKDENVNLGNKDADMTYDDQGATEQQLAFHQSGFEQEEEDAHVTLTLVLDAQKTGDPTQSFSKSVQATKGTRSKTKAKVAKSDKKKQPSKKPKAKGLVVLSEVALTKAGYQKKQERLSHITCKWLR